MRIVAKDDPHLAAFVAFSQSAISGIPSLATEFATRDELEARPHPRRAPPARDVGTFLPEPTELEGTPEENTFPPFYAVDVLDDLESLLAKHRNDRADIDEALLRLIDEARGSQLERKFLQRIMNEDALSERVRVTCAKMHMTRGEPGLALRLLRRGPLEDAASQLLLSELFQELGDLERAAASAHAAVAADMTLPGALERSTSLKSIVARARDLLRPGAGLDEPPGEALEEGARETLALAKRRIAALVDEGRRVRAIVEARVALRGRSDAELAATLVDLVRRLRTTPMLHLHSERWSSTHDHTMTLLDQQEVTIGRVDADICVPSPLVSRSHLRITRSEQGVEVRDLCGRNRTTRSGAPFTSCRDIGQGIVLELAGEVRCAIAPLDPSSKAGPLLVRTPRKTAIVTFGDPARVGGFVFRRQRSGSTAYWCATREGRTTDLLLGDRLEAVAPATHDMVVVDDPCA